MYSMDSEKEVGFTGRTMSMGDYLQLKIPENTVKSLGLEKGDLLNVKLRNMTGDSISVNRKVQCSGNQHRFYLPKKIIDELDLEKSELVDVFLSKD